MPATEDLGHYLERIYPRVQTIWRGRWSQGQVEPWRQLFDHELILFQAGKCRVTITDQIPADAPLSSPGFAGPNAKAWSAIPATKAAPWRAKPLSGTVYDCPAGTFLIIPPNAPHLTLVDEGPVQRTCIHFDWISTSWTPTPICTVPPDRPDPALIRFAPDWIPAGPIHGRIRARRTIDDLAETIFHRWATRRQDERLSCRAVLLEMLIRLLCEDGEAQLSAAPELAQDIKQLLDEHLTETTALPDLLMKLDRSYEHLCRVFTSHFGISPMRYITSARIERAKVLLSKADFSVAAIGKQVGYSDAAYFSRLFRAHVGVNPQAFRLSLTNGK